MRRSSTAPLPVLAAGLMAVAFPLALGAAPFLALPFLAQPAAAQMLNGPITPDTPAPRPRQEAPALPGLSGRPKPAPIPANPGQNLGPQEALFDAIDRGDLAAARDAMARGADLNARNALGLTPLDSSVDQNRSEITFFLLSNRPVIIGAPPPSATSSAAARNVPLAAPSPQAMRSRAPVAAPPRPTAPLSSSRSADGGAPRPDKGFLGFDAGRPTGG